jgi:hypothetical protein
LLICDEIQTVRHNYLTLRTTVVLTSEASIRASVGRASCYA